MDKLIEEMRKEAEPVVQFCRGEGFTEEQKKFLAKVPVCDKIDPVVQESGKPDFLNPACRCRAYYKPEFKWRLGRCPLASHYNPYIEVEKPKQL